MLKLKGQKGFTLIELLIVIMILGILAAGAILGVQGFMGKGQLESINTEVASLKVAAIAYIADNPSGGEIDIDKLRDAGLITKEPVAEYEIDPDGTITGDEESNPYGFYWDGGAQEWSKTEPES